MVSRSGASATDATWRGACDGTVSAFAINSACIVEDSLRCDNSAGGTNNGSAGVHFDIINTSSSPVTITGFGQGNAYGSAAYGGCLLYTF